jgi:HSP20 family protein
MTQMVDQSVERQFSKFNMSMPTLTLHEKNNVYQVETSLPGISPEDISISYKNGYVTVSGKKKTSTVSADGNSSSEYHQQFYNTIRVPGNPDTKLIKASTSHGLLTISIPK